MREFSWLAVIIGVIVGALLAAANAFVGLKVGMTISASIPAAVMALLVLRTLLRRGTILESNVVQTVGSAGESLAAGMIFTVPALFMMGQDAAYWEMVLWGCIGGLLGVCFMVPLRYVLIVREHGVLPFPEGVACAEVLESGERGAGGARPVIWGTIAGGVFYLFSALQFWQETSRIALARVRTEFQLESSPALLGVGYILGARVAAYLLSGALIAWFMLIPAIAFFGADVDRPIFPASDKLIASMTPQDIWSSYIRYIGAGAVAIGGLISLIKGLPTILSSLGHMMGGVLRRGAALERTERDVPFPLVILGIIALGYVIWRAEGIHVDHIGAVAVVVFTFFFVTVSSRLVGIVGSSSNPISGMTIATLLATAMVYKIFVIDRDPGMTPETLTHLKSACIVVGALVAMAIAMAGDMSQDLKTGFLVKATPWKQEIGKVVGILTSVLAVAGIVLLLNDTYGFGEKTAEKPYPLIAPQANIMKILVDGVLGGNVPWVLLMIGGASAVIVEMLGLPALPVAVGMYLPLGLSTPIMVGGIVRWLIDRRKKGSAEHDPGVLTASGLVAGQGLMGVALAGVAALVSWLWADPRWVNPLSGEEERVAPIHFVPWLWSKFEGLPTKWGLSEAWWDLLAMFPFALLVLWLWWTARRQPPVVPAAPPSPPSGPPPSPPGDPDLQRLNTDYDAYARPDGP